MENVRIKLFGRPYETAEDSPWTGKSSCLHTFQSETICIDSAFRACASRPRNPTLGFLILIMTCSKCGGRRHFITRASAYRRFRVTRFLSS